MPVENTEKTGGAGTNQDDNAGSEAIEMTKKELQSKIDAAVRSALETREKNLQKQHEDEIAQLNEEIEQLKTNASKGSQTLEEQLKNAETQKAKLAAEVKTLKKQATDLTSRFGEMLTAEMGALGDKGKAQFEQICPDGLNDADKLVFLSKVKSLLVEGESQQSEQNSENTEQEKPRITQHEQTRSGGDESSFGKQMAEQKRAEENAASEEGFNPWGQ